MLNSIFTLKISDFINNPSKLEEIFERAIKERNEEIANILARHINDPWLIYKYAKEIVKGKVSEELERVIAKDGNCCYYYTRNVLKAPYEFLRVMDLRNKKCKEVENEKIL